MTYEQKAERRRKAAGLVAAGKTPDAVARELGMTRDWVKCCCYEHDTEIPRKISVIAKGTSFAIVAALQNRNGQSLADIARKYKVSDQRVGQIRDRARAAKIKGVR